MAVMTIPQVKEARQMAADALKRHGYSPTLQIQAKEEFVKVVKDVFSDVHHEQPGVIGLHVYNGTGGMFIGLLERVQDDGLRNAIIKEVTALDNDPARVGGTNRYPAKISAGQTSLMLLLSGCTTSDISELGRIASRTTKFTDPDGMPDFMKSAAARGLYVGSRYL